MYVYVYVYVHVHVYVYVYVYVYMVSGQSGQSGLTESKVLQVLFGGDLWPTQLRTSGNLPGSVDI